MGVCLKKSGDAIAQAKSKDKSTGVAGAPVLLLCGIEYRLD